METLIKKISLEPYITRFPICWPSLNGDAVDFIDVSNTVDCLKTNYGKLPLGVNEDCVDEESTFPSAMKGKVLSFQVLQRWFVEMFQYKKFLYSQSCNNLLQDFLR